MNSKLSDDFQNGRRELQVAENGAADEALEKLKPFLKPDKAKDARLVLTRIVSKSHSGPIPSAEELEHLEQVLPGAANRCFEMAEREQAHRHEIGTSIVTKEFSLRGRGQWLAIAGLIFLLSGVAYLGYLGDTKSAAALGIATIIGVVSMFVSGTWIENRGEAPEVSRDNDQKKLPNQSSVTKPKNRR